MTVRHIATQYVINLSTDGGTLYHRVRQAPFDESPSGKRMRFWGAIAAGQSSMLIQGIRRAESDDRLPSSITPAQNLRRRASAP